MKKILGVLLALAILFGSFSAHAQMQSISKTTGISSYLGKAILGTKSAPDTIVLVSGAGYKFDTITAPFSVLVEFNQTQNVAGVDLPVPSFDNEIFTISATSGDTLVFSGRAQYGTHQRAWGPGSIIRTTNIGLVSQLRDSSAANHRLLDSLFAGTPTFAGAITVRPTTNQINLGAAAHLTTISSTAPAGASQTLTIPDAGGAASFVLTAGTQTIGGAKTLSSALTINPTTNQLVLGATAHTLTINSVAPAAAANTLLLMDAGATDTFAYVSKTNYGVSTTPTGNVSTTEKAMGLGLVQGFSITPVVTGRVMIIITGMALNSTAAGDGTNITGRYGTGTAPSNGATTGLGTAFGTPQNFIASTTAGQQGFTCMGQVVGLALNTAVWFDLSLLAVTGGGSSVKNVQILVWEY